VFRSAFAYWIAQGWIATDPTAPMRRRKAAADRVPRADTNYSTRALARYISSRACLRRSRSTSRRRGAPFRRPAHAALRGRFRVTVSESDLGLRAPGARLGALAALAGR
jgi:hypothetical protein